MFTTNHKPMAPAGTDQFRVTRLASSNNATNTAIAVSTFSANNSACISV